MISTTTLLVASIVAAAASAGAGAYSSVSAANAQEDASKYNEAVSRNNALAASQQAQFDADRIRDRNRRVAGAQRAALAKSGVDISAGTALDIAADSEIQGELDVAAAIYSGRVSSGAEEARARLFGMQASSASKAGKIGLGASLLGGAGDALSIGSSPSFRNT